MDRRDVSETEGRHGGPNIASGENDSKSGSQSIRQESGCQVDHGSTAGIEVKVDYDKDPGAKAAADLMKRIDECAEIGEEEYKNVHDLLFNPQSSCEKTLSKTQMGRLEQLDNSYTNNPMPIPHTRVFDKSIVEWSNLGYLFSQPEQVACSPKPLSPSVQAPSLSPLKYPQQVASLQCESDIKTDGTSLPASSTVSSSPQLSTSTGQPTSADQPQSSTSTVPPGIGLSYMYASKASRVKNINSGEDPTILTSTLPKSYSKGGAHGQAEAKETSLKPKFSEHVARLHAERGLNKEEKIKTKEEWKEITSQVKETRMDQKSFTEAVVDMETLLQLYKLQRLMTRYFTIPPRSIYETFEMAYRVVKVGKPTNPPGLTRRDESHIAKRLSMELLGIIPRYEDFPVPYMAGIEVPEEWFYHRFKCISGFDRLRFCTSATGRTSHTWVAPVRYNDRRNLRSCYVRPEFIAHDFIYDRISRKSSRKCSKVGDLLLECAGPPFRPLPVKEAFIHMNPAVLRNYKVKFENYILKIKENQARQRKRVTTHFNDRFDVTKNNFEMFQSNYKCARARYNRRCSGQALREWNRYFYEQTVSAYTSLQRIIDVAQIGMLLSIKYSDGWIFKMEDLEEMLKYKIPLFDPSVVDERPPQE